MSIRGDPVTGLLAPRRSAPNAWGSPRMAARSMRSALASIASVAGARQLQGGARAGGGSSCTLAALGQQSGPGAPEVAPGAAFAHSWQTRRGVSGSGTPRAAAPLLAAALPAPGPLHLPFHAPRVKALLVRHHPSISCCTRAPAARSGRRAAPRDRARLLTQRPSHATHPRHPPPGRCRGHAADPQRSGGRRVHALRCKARRRGPLRGAGAR